MKEGEIWIYVPDVVVMRGSTCDTEAEVPPYASLYLVLAVGEIVYLLDLRSGQEVTYYDIIQEDEYVCGWRRIRA